MLLFIVTIVVIDILCSLLRLPYILYKIKRIENSRGRRKTRGYIYVVYNKPIISFVKIGKTVNLKHRLNAYQTFSPIGLGLLQNIYTKDIDRLEKLIHTKFRYLKISLGGGTEWFILTPGLYITLVVISYVNNRN